MKYGNTVGIVFLILCCSGCKMEMAENHMGGIYAHIEEPSQGERAKAVKEKLEQIQEITGNAVVIEGHTAIIGLRMEKTDQKQAKTLIGQAEWAAKNAEADIQNVSVTTNESIVALIEKEEKKRSR